MINKNFLIILLVFCFAIFNEANANMHKKTIMIDLDGVLDNYEKYTEDIPSIKKGAKEFIVKLSKDYELILFTTRPLKSC